MKKFHLGIVFRKVLWYTYWSEPKGNEVRLITHKVWEREAQVRAVALGKPGKPWDSWADSTFPLAGNWSKIGVDHMFDHNWKIS